LKRFVYLKDVVTLQLHVERCIGCGMCTLVCPHGVFRMDNGQAQIDYRDACMECGACAQNCPTEAVTVQTGVGCAAAVINSLLGRDSSSCCCSLDTEEKKTRSADCSDGKNEATCC
jgi:ferredoxin